MHSEERTYIAIDLKSFFASVECVERGLDPLTTNLLVADVSRTEKTICLAVSPSLKAYGIGGRARLFEAIQRLKEVNCERMMKTPGYRLTGKTWDDTELKQHPDWEVDYIAAPPRMAKYIKYSTQIYEIYLKYVAPEDIHVYSIDEVIMDVTSYLKTPSVCSKTETLSTMEKAKRLTLKIIKDVLKSTGITATAGIGTNMYLCKVAMDIVAKHIPADKDGVRIATLDEKTYREQLWDYTPITKFWRIGRGIATKLAQYGMQTMGDIALCSVKNEEVLYKLFGVNAELIIDHAWGWEPCTIDYVKAYKPETNSLSTGQVLQCAYDFSKARIVIQEMAEAAALDLVSKRLVANQIVLTVGYDIESLTNPEIKAKYQGPITRDYYGREVPKYAHGSIQLGKHTSSTEIISKCVQELYDRVVNHDLLIRRLNLTTNHVVPEDSPTLRKEKWGGTPIQLDLFTDYEKIKEENQQQEEKLTRERRMQEALLGIKRRYGKNSILRGLNLEEGATAIERNKQIGGHKA
ncbi:MAG: DNA methylase [Bacteroidaceae bacterium]|nr:DNA methylase [Bacteroidaceae bacterium]